MTQSPGVLFERLLEIMARLRGSDGCPWDREQTRESLKPFLLEEAYEVLEAIESGRSAALEEELGDLLFQVVFHAHIAAEGAEFTVVDVLSRLRQPFNVNLAAQAAGIAAMADIAHVERSRAHNERWLAWLTEEIGKLGLEVTPSVGNFILIHFPTATGKTAAEADAFLTARGLILRRVAAYKLPNALRMSVGTEEANRLVVKALADFLEGVK